MIDYVEITCFSTSIVLNRDSMALVSFKGIFSCSLGVNDSVFPTLMKDSSGRIFSNLISGYFSSLISRKSDLEII